MKVSLIGSDTQENPFGTKEGQSVVSVAESFWARIAREGKPVSTQTIALALPNDSTYKSTSLSASVDTLLYPKFIAVSSNVDAELIIQLNTGIPQLNSKYLYRGYHKAGTPVLLICDGEFVSAYSAGSIAIGGINTGAGAGIIYGSIFGYEVSINA